MYSLYFLPKYTHTCCKPHGAFTDSTAPVIGSFYGNKKAIAADSRMLRADMSARKQHWGYTQPPS